MRTRLVRTTFASPRTMFASLIAALAACILSGPCIAQSASYRIYGSTCKPTTAAPLPLMAVGVPKIGSTFTVRTDGSWATFASSGVTMLTLGASDKTWGNLKLPFDLRRLSRVGLRYHCALLATPDLVFALPNQTGPRKLYDVRFAIPNSRSLIGVRFYQQAHMFLYGIGETEVISSPGGAGVIGT